MDFKTTTKPSFLLTILFVLCIVSAACFPGTSYGADTDDKTADSKDAEPLSIEAMLNMDIRDLMNIEVTSVSKKPQTLSESAAAVFVITQEDIRRSGETSIPEILRMVPGLQVNRTYSDSWEVTSRGAVGPYSNKLLVLVDGRSVYTPIDSEVIWGQLQMILEDIERIEVIRGPGATMWGANAVNGIINIITKKADDTQGGLVTSSVSNHGEWDGGVRYGGKLGENTYYRIYAKYQQPDNMLQPEVIHDDAYGRAGLRVDHYIADGDHLAFLGEVNNGITKAGTSLAVLDNGSPSSLPFEEHASNSGRYLLARWSHKFSSTSDMELQTYYDYTGFDDTYYGSPANVIFKQSSETYDFDFKHRFALLEINDVLWGVGVRSIHEKVENMFSWSFAPNNRDSYIYSAFIQDDIELIRNRLKLIVGSKFEHNSFTGFEIQPNVRAVWTPSPVHTVWAAVSRAVRTPTLVESNSSYVVDVLPPGSLYPGSPSSVVELKSSADYRSEELMAHELGYRVQPAHNIYIDLTTFYNNYTKLRTFEPGAPTPTAGYFVIPYNVANKMSGKSVGTELAVNWQALDWWRLQPSFAYLNVQFNLDSDSNDTISQINAQMNPHKKFMFRSLMDLTKKLELDSSVYYTDAVPVSGLKSYTDLNIRIAWKPVKGLEISLVGQNLLDNLHTENSSSVFLSAMNEIRRSVTGKVTWRF
ncbi:MAG: TonB-dependent receptor [Dissulfurispiraceae bacterium]